MNVKVVQIQKKCVQPPPPTPTPHTHTHTHTHTHISPLFTFFMPIMQSHTTSGPHRDLDMKGPIS